MEKLSSQPIIKSLKKKFGNKFNIATESKNKFNFDGAYYQPDLVFYSKENNNIKAIIEVEQGTRKHTVGGVITADYCMGKLKQNPIMVVLALTDQDRNDYIKRIKMLKRYIKHLKNIIIGNKAEIIKILKQIP
ncbi:MAG: hypothetical protein FJZ16_00560 [Candidatus Omnitrophica bacterium]|nr:hypothetical protein [Candidatus Omnitrophota bacterium]